MYRFHLHHDWWLKQPRPKGANHVLLPVVDHFHHWLAELTVPRALGPNYACERTARFAARRNGLAGHLPLRKLHPCGGCGNEH